MLAVEDDAAIRALVSEVCYQQGHDVLEAATGAQAIEFGLATQPDLVLVDWVLPDLNGTEVIRELRKQGVTCPMVMLTGRTTKMDEVVGLEVGADDYITKPFDSRFLAARLNAHLRRAALGEGTGGREGMVSIGSLQIDGDARRVGVEDQRLRRKLADQPKSGVILEAVPRLGYRLSVRSD